MDLTCLAFIGAILLLLGLGVLVYDSLRRKQNQNPYHFPDVTTHALDDTALQAQLQPSPPSQTSKPQTPGIATTFLRLYSAAVQAGGRRISRWKQPRSSQTAIPTVQSRPTDLMARIAAVISRRALVVIVTASLALCVVSVTILVTGANGSSRPPGVVIGIARFAGAPQEGSSDPTTLLADDILRGADGAAITIRSSRIVPVNDSQAQAERARLDADFLIWGDFGPSGAITANLVLSPDFAPVTQPWQTYDDPDPDLLILPASATVYLRAGGGLDPLVPLSLALVRWHWGDFAGASVAAWGAQATLDENGGSSLARFPSVVQAYARLAQGDYSDTASVVDSIEDAGAIGPPALLARSAARLLTNDYSGASDDANRVISDRDATAAILARAYLLRARARYNVGSLTDALGDLDQAARLDPTLLRVRLERAETYYRQAQPSLANDELVALLKSAPSAAPAYRLLGLVRLMQGQPDGALEPLSKARELYAGWTDAQRKDEAQAEAQGDSHRAHAASDNIVTLNKRLAGIALYEGMAYADKARNEPSESFLAGIWRGIRGEPSTADRALARMQEASRLDPRRPDIPLQMGSFYTFLGQFDKAEEQLRLALDLDPNSPDSYMALAQLQENEGKAADAISTLESFVATSPRYYPAYDYLYNLYTSAGNPQQAQAALENALSVEPLTPGDHLWRGKILITLGRQDEAIGELQAATADPEVWEAHFLLGNIYADQGRGPDALAEYQAVLAKRPNHAGALLGAGRLLVLAGRGDEAQTLLERLTSVAPSNVEGHISLLGLLLAKGETDRAVAEGERAVAANPERADAYFFLGTAYEAREDWAKAADAYKSATDRNPQDFQSFLNWARTLLRQDLYSSSIDVSNQAITLRPSDPQPYRWRAESQLALGNADGALSSLGDAVRLGPNDPFALALTARAYTTKGDEQSALDYANQSFKARPQDATGQLALGDIYLTWGQASEAIQAFGTATELASTDYDVALALTGEARAYMLSGDTQHAMQYFAQATQRDPNAGEPHLYLGTLYTQANAGDDALREYRSAVALRPNWPLALYYVGKAYLLRRDLTDAGASFSRAVQYSPNMFQAWFGLGLAYRDGGHPQEAVQAFTKASTLKPDYAEAWLYLGLTLEESGDRASATEAFSHARDTAPTDAIRAQAEEGLSRVR